METANTALTKAIGAAGPAGGGGGAAGYAGNRIDMSLGEELVHNVELLVEKFHGSLSAAERAMAATERIFGERLSDAVQAVKEEARRERQVGSAIAAMRVFSAILSGFPFSFSSPFARVLFSLEPFLSHLSPHHFYPTSTLRHSPVASLVGTLLDGLHAITPALLHDWAP